MVARSGQTSTNPVPNVYTNQASPISDSKIAFEDYKRARKNYQKALWKDPTYKRRLAVLSIICMLVLASICAFAYSADHGKGWFGSSGTIYIKATSAHISNTVTVTITVNGVEVDKEALSVLSSITYDFKAMFFDDSESYKIVVTSEGGGLGAMQDSRTITLEKGATENVSFVI